MSLPALMAQCSRHCGNQRPGSSAQGRSRDPLGTSPGWHDASCGLLDPAEEALWTTRADGRVRLRIDPICSQTPRTVHQMFSTTLDKYGDLSAMGFKQQGTWEHISYTQYYLLARKAAKGFLKVRELPKAWPLPSPALLPVLAFTDLLPMPHWASP